MQSRAKDNQRREDKARIGAQSRTRNSQRRGKSGVYTLVHEHLEPILNAVLRPQEVPLGYAA